MNPTLKKIAVPLLNILTLGRGISKKINGVSITFPPAYFRYFPADYESDNFVIIKNTIKKGDHIIDIGAHIGLMSVVLGKMVGDKGKIYSFEPSPLTFSILNKTIKLNNLQHIITPINKAVSITNGVVEFNADFENVSNSMVLYENNKFHKKIKVATTSLDDFIKEKEIKQLDFIKIDAEGVELDVLKGARETLKNFNASMILAIHPLAITAKKDSLNEIFDFVSQAGYSMVWKDKEISRSIFCEQKDVFDIFCKKIK